MIVYEVAWECIDCSMQVMVDQELPKKDKLEDICGYCKSREGFKLVALRILDD